MLCPRNSMDPGIPEVLCRRESPTHLEHNSDSIGRRSACSGQTQVGKMLATIGYERATLADFVATLQFSNVEVLIDVRERAQSRRPGFSKKALEAALLDAGIGYLHLPQLGDPKAGREAARSGNMAQFRQIYNAVISEDAALKALDLLQDMAREQHICLMCFERDQHECHRKIVADKLEDCLKIRATHLGVVQGASNGGRNRRVLHTHQSAAASL